MACLSVFVLLSVSSIASVVAEKSLQPPEKLGQNWNFNDMLNGQIEGGWNGDSGSGIDSIPTNGWNLGGSNPDAERVQTGRGRWSGPKTIMDGTPIDGQTNGGWYGASGSNGDGIPTNEQTRGRWNKGSRSAMDGLPKQGFSSHTVSDRIDERVPTVAGWAIGVGSDSNGSFKNKQLGQEKSSGAMPTAVGSPIENSGLKMDGSPVDELIQGLWSRHAVWNHNDDNNGQIEDQRNSEMKSSVGSPMDDQSRKDRNKNPRPKMNAIPTNDKTGQKTCSGSARGTEGLSVNGQFGDGWKNHVGSNANAERNQTKEGRSSSFGPNIIGAFKNGQNGEKWRTAFGSGMDEQNRGDWISQATEGPSTKANSAH
ncbi:hypothetical protein L596_030386 [Steinernema carpocapsae]|uniref:Uncharacterized protein n=1 Tax=Steinernema carpocapsae TaxID=34508 RepID=A0A4U5LP81_STECR|nr:hypothetical protein L596_030386 [Steinernema carpocapsae]